MLISDEFVARHKKKPSDFTRKRKLPFHYLVTFLINIAKNSYQVELNFFFKALGGWETVKQCVSSRIVQSSQKTEILYRVKQRVWRCRFE